MLDFDYSINGHVEYKCEENCYVKPIPIVWLHQEDADGNGIDDVTDALTSVNYLIITDADRLFRLNSGDEEGVNMLLQEAAVLAKMKYEALAYLFDWTWDFNAETLRALISRSGAFGSRLGPGFNRILIIGGPEIIPMGHRSTPYGEIFTDDYYADIDDDGRLDFIVNRVTGTNARDLLRELVALMERDP